MSTTVARPARGVRPSPMSSRGPSTPQQEKPENGIKGLKHLRHDILSGMVVSLVSLPLSSGIAIASGLPPIYGLISAIIAGLVFPLIGGAYMTIAGPAAGLAPALLAIMTAMGGAGDAEHVGEGYRFLLCVIFAVGVLQVILAGLRLANLAAIFPISVVEGMLASIGLLIFVKQIPMFFGYTGTVHAHEFFEYLAEVPKFAAGMNPYVTVVSASCLALLLVLSTIRNARWLKIVPPQLIAVVVGSIMAIALNLKSINPSFLITLPTSLFHGFHMPEFGALLKRTDLWGAAIVGVVTLTLIDGVESLATAMAVDRIDPYRRKSRPNRVLLAMGVCNVVSSLVGGLTIIPGGVKSKANVASGGRTLWANFTNAICLIVYLAVGAVLINTIPKGALAAVLIFTGYKMFEPAIWSHIAKIGRDQLALFTLTVVSTLLTDLLWGILIGVCANFVLNLVLYRKALKNVQQAMPPRSWTKCAIDLFRNPVARRELDRGTYHLYLNRPLVSFNSMHLTNELELAPPLSESIEVHFGPNVPLVDHTACENLLGCAEEFSNKNVPVEFDGFHELNALSKHHASTRMVRRPTATVELAPHTVS